MKTILLSLMLLPLQAFCADLILPTPGTFNYSGEYKVLQKIRFENVYGFTDAGRARLEELRKQNYICEPKIRQIYQCKAFLNVSEVDQRLEDRVESQMEGMALTIGSLEGKPTLVSQGDVVQEWNVPMSANIHGKDYKSLRYLISQGLHKIFLGAPAEESFLPVSAEEMNYVVSLPITQSNEVFEVYTVETKFVRQ